MTPNIAVGSFMAGEAIHLANGSHLDDRLSFDIFDENRIYISPENDSQNSCSCRSKNGN